MTQSVVNFLEQIGSGSGAQFLTDPRIFDFEVSNDAQLYYQYQMYRILNALHAQVVDSSGTSHAVTFTISGGQVTTNLTDGRIIFDPNQTVSSSDANTIQSALDALNSWSAMKGVINGQQYYLVNGSVDTNGNLLGTVMIVDSSGQAKAYNGATLNASTGVYTLGAVINPPPLMQNPADPSNPSDQIPQTALFTPPSGTTDIFGSTITTVGTTMDQYMAQSVDQLIRTLRSAGIDLTTSGATAAPILDSMTKASAGIFNLSGILQAGAASGKNAHIVGDSIGSSSSSIQQVLMVDYISTGNQVLFNQMDQLKQAIDINGSALSYLNSLQDLMNQKDPQQFVMQLQDLNNVQINNSPQSAFDQFEQDTYNNALNTISKVNADNPGTLESYLNTLAGTPATIGTSNNVSTIANLLANYSNLYGLGLTATQSTDLQHALTIIGTKVAGDNGGGNTITNTTFLDAINTTGPGNQGFDLNEATTRIKNYFAGVDVSAANLTPDETTIFNQLLATAAKGVATAVGPSATSPLAAGAFKDLNTSMNSVYGYSRTQILGNLQYLMNQISAQSGGSSSQLINSLQKIYDDINGLDPNTGLTDWIQDTQTNNVGQFQNDLSNAIVASQSFNDTQRENLRNVMFIFQEFYQSSSGLLSRLTQLIEKMADGIAR